MSRFRFVGRKAELEVLESAYRSGESGLVPIYGRRRIGKSELILRFLHGKSGVYYCGKTAPAGLQIEEFLREAAASLREPLLERLKASSWQDVLSAVVDRWKGKRTFVLALDEFQWIVEASPELPSAIQELWDRRWSRRGNLLLILCGSYVGFMERQILGRRSPLFGRRTAQILLRPFHYGEAADFHPSYSLLDRARTYFLCGGIPLYLKFFSAEKSVEANIADNFLNPNSSLFQEPEFLLREELRELEKYYGILLAIACGQRTLAGVAAQAGIENRGLNYYLKQLTELGYISRRFPLSGAKPSKRQVRYVLEDPLLRFWFRFVYPNMSRILQIGRDQALRTSVLPRLDAYFGECYERLCREALPFLYRAEGTHCSFEVGEYWDEGVQIDVVGLRDDNWTDLGESKWGAVRSVAGVEADLRAKLAHFPNRRGATVGLRIFTRDSPGRRSKVAGGLRLHTLEDLYAAARTRLER